MGMKVLYRVRIQRLPDYKGVACFWIKSRTRPNLIHHQVIDRKTGRVYCSCEWGAIHLRCEPHFWKTKLCHHLVRALNQMRRKGELDHFADVATNPFAYLS